MVKNNFTTRLIFGIIFLLIAITPALLTAYAGSTGKIIGLILIALAGMLGYFEILVAMKFSKLVAFFCSLVVPLFMVMPINQDFVNLIKFNEGWTMFLIIRYAFKTYIPWIILVFFAFLPLIFDWKIKFTKEILKKQAGIIIITLLIPVFCKMIWLINIEDFIKFVYFVMIAVISDTMGYVGGYLFGKKWFKGKKLAPKISPSKTWAGFVVGFVFALIFAILFGYYLNVWAIYDNQLLWSIIFGIILSLVSPLGDLLFSWIKRNEQVKDFSNLIPGHGGLFDRLDAMSLVFFFGAFFYIFA